MLAMRSMRAALVGLTLVCALAGLPSQAQDRQNAPSAIIESIEAADADYEYLELLPAGTEIRLGRKGRLRLAYLRSCIVEDIEGGTVTIGEIQSRIEGSVMRSRETVQCDSGIAPTERQAQDVAGVAIRAPEVQSDRPVARVYGNMPVFAIADPVNQITIERIDSKIVEVYEFPVENRRLDLMDHGVSLAPGGLYRAKAGNKEVVFQIFRSATAWDSAVISRLVRFADASPRPATGLSRIPALLGDFGCADLSLSFSRQGEILLSGHVASAEDLQRLDGDVRGLVQNLGELRNEVEVYKWPFCLALETIGAIRARGKAAAQAPVVRPYEHDSVYRGGEALVVEAMAGDRSGGYLYVDFLQGDGNVVHMLPFKKRPDNRIAAGGRVLLGAEGMQYIFAPPFGTEMLIVIASPVPLFEELRPDVERAEGYFPALRRVLEARIGEGHRGELLGSYAFLTTRSE